MSVCKVRQAASCTAHKPACSPHGTGSLGTTRRPCHSHKPARPHRASPRFPSRPDALQRSLSLGLTPRHTPAGPWRCGTNCKSLTACSNHFFTPQNAGTRTAKTEAKSSLNNRKGQLNKHRHTHPHSSRKEYRIEWTAGALPAPSPRARTSRVI